MSSSRLFSNESKQQRYEPSGLTMAECKQMAQYLNKNHNPTQNNGAFWEAGKVNTDDVPILKFESQTPIVRLDLQMHKHSKSLTKWERNTQNKLKDIRDYFQTHFKKYHFDKYRGCFCITDRGMLSQLRDEALKDLQLETSSDSMKVKM